MAGKTASSNFPSVNAFQLTKGVANDAFVTKISADPAGTTQVKILWSSYLGGNDVDVANGIALDRRDNVYVAGETESAAGFPILGPNGAFQSALRGNNDAFATKIAETRGDTIGVFHTVGTPQFLLRNTNSGGSADQTVTFGENGDLPVAGDWDGNGIDDVGVFRPSAGQFLLRQFGVIRVCNPFCITTFGFTTITVPFGQAGDLPIVGDWDGDGDDTVGVYRPSNTTFFLSNSNQNPQNNIISVFGEAEDLPVAGDWNADGVDTIGVYRPSAARFNLSTDNSAISLNFIFGTAGDAPVAGDWDGNP